MTENEYIFFSGFVITVKINRYFVILHLQHIYSSCVNIKWPNEGTFLLSNTTENRSSPLIVKK